MLHGIDIAEHQATLQLKNLKGDIDFVMIRAGYGGDYTHQDDIYFNEFVKQAEAAGIPWGTYLYSYGLSVSAAKSEAEHVLRVLDGRKPVMGVWYDMEDADGYKARNGMPSNDTLAEMCATFCDAIAAEGIYTGIYASLSWFSSYLSSHTLDKYDKWVAQWNKTCDYKGDYSIWQYTSSHKDAGYTGKLDANYLVRDFRDSSTTDKPTDDKPATDKQPETTSGNSKSRVLATGTNQVTQAFGNGHGGIDLVKQTNALDNITAHSAGTVVWAQSGIPNDTGSSGNRSYGNAVKILHPNGYFTLYAHMASIKVKAGDKVTQGQVIGYMGNTGNSYGAHLHFEVRTSDNTRINPAPYINADLPDLDTSTSTPSSPDTTSGTTGDMTYSVYTKKSWQDPIVNYGEGSDGYAGLYGNAIEGIKIDAKNCDVYYRAHVLGGDWLEEIKNSGEGSDGYAGIYGKTIDGLQIRVPQGKVTCRVHLQNGKWLEWVIFGREYTGGKDGYAGVLGKPIDGVQMW